VSQWASHRTPNMITIEPLRAKPLKWRWSAWTSLEQLPDSHELMRFRITSRPTTRGAAALGETATDCVVQLKSFVGGGGESVAWPCLAHVYGTTVGGQEFEKCTKLLDGLRAVLDPPFISVAVSRQWSVALSEAHWGQPMPIDRPATDFERRRHARLDLRHLRRHEIGRSVPGINWGTYLSPALVAAAGGDGVISSAPATVQMTENDGAYLFTSPHPVDPIDSHEVTRLATLEDYLRRIMLRTPEGMRYAGAAGDTFNDIPPGMS
jgi:hypothetical protein